MKIESSEVYICEVCGSRDICKANIEYCERKHKEKDVQKKCEHKIGRFESVSMAAWSSPVLIRACSECKIEEREEFADFSEEALEQLWKTRSND